MKPILFDKNATDFSNNGIGVLYETIDCNVYEARNGEFDLEMEYPLDGEWFNDILDQRIILAKPNDVDSPHAFRIHSIDKNLDDGVVYIDATSVTNDLSGNIVLNAKVENATAQIALSTIRNKLVEPTRFDLISDIETETSSEWTRLNPLQAIAGTRGSLVDLWGGEIKRTNNAIHLYSRRGRDKVTVIRPGKNIDGFNMVVSTASLVTRIIPYYEYSFGGLQEYEMVKDYNGKNVKQAKYSKREIEPKEYTIYGDTVVSEFADRYSHNEYRTIDYSMDEELSEKVDKFIQDKQDEVDNSSKIIDVSGFPNELKDFVKAELDKRAKGYFTYENPGIDKPKVEMNVDILQLSDSPEWKDFEDLERIQLTDTIEVYIKKFDVDVEVKIESINYDSIGERVTNLKAGSVQTTFGQSVDKEYQDQTSNLRDELHKFENGVNNVIQRTADGLNRKFTGYTEPPASISEEGDLWFKLVGEGEFETYIFNGGRWEAVINDAVFEELRQDVEQAVRDANEAFNKAEQARQDAEESLTKAQEGFDKAQEALGALDGFDDRIDEAFDAANQSLTQSQQAFNKAQANSILIDDFAIRIGDNEDNYASITGIVGGLQTEVSKKVDENIYNSKVTQLSDAIESKMSLSDADGRYTKTTTFTQTINGIQSDISKKVDATTYNSKVTQLSDQIQSKISTTDANSRFTTQTVFNQFVDSFSTRVEEIENWEIGGRNLESDSNFRSGSINGWGPATYFDVSVSNGIATFTCKLSYSANRLEKVFTGLEVDKTYTLTIYADLPKQINWRNFTGATILSDELLSVNTGSFETYSVTFKALSDRVTVKGYMSNLPVGTKVYMDWYVLTKGNVEATDWSPTPEDTEQKFSAINQTVDSIATRVQTTENNYSSISQTVSGVQTKVENAEGNISTLTTLANANQTKIQNAEGQLSTLTQTSNSLVSRITTVENWEIGGRNFVRGSDVAVTKPMIFGLLYATSLVPSDVVLGDQYILSFRGTFPTGLHISVTTDSLDGSPTNSIGGNIVIPASNVDKYYEYPLIAHRTIQGTSGLTISTSQATKTNYNMYEVKLEKGVKATGWSIAPEDTANKIQVESQISQLQDAINLRVTKNDVINQINIDTSGILLSGKKIQLDGDTTVLGTFRVKNANIESISASKMTTGVLDAAKVSITNLDVNRLVGNVATFVGNSFNSISSYVKITYSGLETYNGGSLTSRLTGNHHQFFRDGNTIGNIGTASWVGDNSYRGLSFQLENKSDYMSWSYRAKSSDNHFTTFLAWHKTSSKTYKGFTMGDNLHVYEDLAVNGAFRTFSASGYRTFRFVNQSFDGSNGVALRRNRSEGAGIFMTGSQSSMVAPISGSNALASLRIFGGSSPRVESIEIYNRTYTSSSQTLRVTNNGTVGRISSSRRYKLLEKPIELEYAMRILDIDMKSWYDKNAIEDYCEQLNTGKKSTDSETIARIGGFIAEDVHDAGLNMFVSYDNMNRPEGIHDNIKMLAFPILKHHENRFEDLLLKIADKEHRISVLENKVSELEDRLTS